MEQALLAGATANGFDTDLWTLERVAVVIYQLTDSTPPLTQAPEDTPTVAAFDDGHSTTRWHPAIRTTGAVG